MVPRILVADAFEGCFVDCRPGLFAAAFAKALFLFLHNCNYFITAQMLKCILALRFTA